MSKRTTKRTDQPERISLAECLREKIRQAGVSVREIARESGVPQPVLSRFAAGTRGLNIQTADKLMGYFDLELTVRRRKSRKS